VSAYGLEILSEAECRALLASARVGRVAVVHGGRPAILPVRYALLDGDVVIRTAPGEKLMAAALHEVVAFEIDAFDEPTRSGWSVDVVGPAEEIVHPDEIARAAALDLEPWAGEARDRYVRIRAEDISGRRIPEPGVDAQTLGVVPPG
jgi:nitroimidazol reductase NimA-like FMN-containing flavoprotein (pyridoxamine 5'-phosphate oxidase superfamily)